MTQQQRENLEQTIAGMSDPEKLGLIEQLAGSLRSSINGGTDTDAVERQRRAFQRIQRKLAGRPPGQDPYARLGYSNEAHDKILYDLEQD